MRDEQPWSEAMRESHASEWDIRAHAAEELGRHLSRQEVRDRLRRLLNDEDTAVVDAATRQLVLHGGRDGLAAAAEVFAYGDEQEGYHIGDAIADLRSQSYPVDAWVQELLALASNVRAREAARRLAQYLGVE